MIRIAICDDAPADQQLLKNLIDRLRPFDGQYAIDVFDGGQALLDSPERPYDMLILDVQMPGLSGYTTAQK